MNENIITLSIPAKAEYLVAVRLVAGTLAGQAGFDVDEIEDVKTACSEACLLLMPCVVENEQLRARLWLENGFQASISAVCEESESMDTPERDISLFLLEALADCVEFSKEDGRDTYRLSKLPLDAILE